jgi:pantetheine-phosphate adenylyltransferase
MRRLAIYPGTFDPPTLGHLDVIERAAALFDNLVVAIGVNKAKSPLLSNEERLQILQNSVLHLKNVKVEAFEGLLVDFAHRHKAKSIVRGLRATADFEYEFQMAMINRRLAEDIDSVFLMTRWDYSYLSSSIVREVALLGGDYHPMVPAAAIPVIEGALAKRRETNQHRDTLVV